jgi:hypothetical protein
LPGMTKIALIPPPSDKVGRDVEGVRSGENHKTQSLNYTHYYHDS